MQTLSTYSILECNELILTNAVKKRKMGHMSEQEYFYSPQNNTSPKGPHYPKNTWR